MVKVYSITECPWCDKVKKYLKSKDIPYEEHNIEVNEVTCQGMLCLDR